MDGGYAYSASFEGNILLDFTRTAVTAELFRIMFSVEYVVSKMTSLNEQSVGALTIGQNIVM